MARKKGAVNYKNNLLISIIKELLPNGELGWQAVAAEYQKASKEDCERDSTDVKKHWIKNLCNGMKKPTGSTGEKTDRVHQCIAIEKQILDKTNSGLLGISSDDEDEGGGTNNESVHVFDVEGGEEGKEEESDIEIVNDPELDAIPCASDADNCNESGAESGGQVVSRPSSTISFSTPAPANAATKKKAAESLMSQKTKNSTNKNKERTSISGAIVQLIEGMKGGNEQSDMSTRMNYLMMRQMERMEERDRRDRKRARKGCKKRHARKKAKLAAFEALPDHGGKMGPAAVDALPNFGDSSSSDSSSCGDSSDSD